MTLPHTIFVYVRRKSCLQTRFKHNFSNNFGLNMSDQSIKVKHFENPYNDYNEDIARVDISNSLILQTSKISKYLPQKWEKTTEKFNKYLKKNDSSVYTGTAGVAMLYLLKNPNDPVNLMAIKDLLQSSTIKSKRRLTFLCGDGGPLAIGAVVAHRLGNKSETKKLIKDLISLKTDAVDIKSKLPNEYLYGRAGYLFSLLYVNKYINPSPIEDKIIKSIIDAIIQSGVKMAEEGKYSCPLMYEWNDSLYLGAAHGLSGILYLLMQAKDYMTVYDMDELVKPTIDYLAQLKFPSGNYPSSLGSKSGDKYIQWCHGAPGFVFLFSMAHKVFSDSRYLQLALRAADVVWKRGLLRKGYSICHGVSGNAYCFLELFQTTKDECHLYRAMKFAEWCLDYSKNHEEHEPDRPLSLYEGIAGPMYLLLDIQDPMNAKFPGYTI